MVKKEDIDNSAIMIADDIPEGSRFDYYIKEFKKTSASKNGDDFELFLSQIFRHCLEYVFPKSIPRLAIKTRLIYNNDQYLAEEKQADSNPKTIRKEIPKMASTAFVIDNGVIATIHFNVERLLTSNSASLVFNYVDTAIHELNHIKNPRMSEQQIHDSGIPILEGFLGISLPDTFKNQKVSDYYFP